MRITRRQLRRLIYEYAAKESNLIKESSAAAIPMALILPILANEVQKKNSIIPLDFRFLLNYLMGPKFGYKKITNKAIPDDMLNVLKEVAIGEIRGKMCKSQSGPPWDCEVDVDSLKARKIGNMSFSNAVKIETSKEDWRNDVYYKDYSKYDTLIYNTWNNARWVYVPDEKKLIMYDTYDFNINEDEMFEWADMLEDSIVWIETFGTRIPWPGPGWSRNLVETLLRKNRGKFNRGFETVLTFDVDIDCYKLEDEDGFGSCQHIGKIRE